MLWAEGFSTPRKENASFGEKGPGVHFLCPHKKRTKESGWGRRCPLRLSLLPCSTKTSSSPSSHPPPDPHPAPVDGWAGVGLRSISNCVYLCDCMIQRIRLHQVCRPAPEGVHRGGRLEAGATGKMVIAVSIGLAGSASPMPASLVTFLSGDKKVTLADHIYEQGQPGRGCP